MIRKVTKLTIFLTSVGISITFIQADNLPPRSENFPELVQQLKTHIERVDQQAEKLKAPDFPDNKDWFNSPPLSLNNQIYNRILKIYLGRSELY